MKIHLIIYAILVLLYIVYNAFFQVEDARLHTAINILVGSVIFLYIAFLAYVFLQNLRKK